MEIINYRRKQLEDTIMDCHDQINKINNNDKDYMLGIRRDYIYNNYNRQLQRSCRRNKKNIKHNYDLFERLKPIIDEYDNMTGINKEMVYDKTFSNDLNPWKNFI